MQLRIGTTGGESDDTNLVAIASKIAAAKNDGSSTIITDGDVVGNDDDNVQNSTIMQLLPSVCRQGILCRVSTVLPGGEGATGKTSKVVVLLGSTLGGTGVFSGADGAWFERVCAHVALGTESSRR